MSATDLEIVNLRREVENLKYVNIEIVEELKKLNALLELQQRIILHSDKDD
jgi:hypothetical protein